MKQVFIFICIFILTTHYTIGQSCLPSGITFQTQQDIDLFKQKYPGCKVIEGDVCIGQCFYNLPPSKIYDISGLNEIVSIKKALKIRANDSLPNLDGLNSLTYIGHNLEMVNNPRMSNIDGISNLKKINCDFIADNNPSLTNIEGLANLDTIAGFMEIILNKNLLNLDGFRNLKSVGKNLNIGRNENLKSLDGLSHLTSINGYLSLYQLNSLPNFHGLHNLTSVSGALGIEDNPAIIDMSGLENLKSVEYMRITNNANLKNLNGLDNITSLNRLDIQTNVNLSSIGYFNQLKTLGEGLFIYKNNGLKTIEGFSSLDSIGYISVDKNDSLTYINGFSKLRTARVIALRENKSLISFSGIQSLKTIRDNFTIEGNESLTSLDGFSNLSTFSKNNYFYNFITNNDALTSLKGIDSLKYIRFLKIIGNDNLISLGGMNAMDLIDNLDIIDNQKLENLNGISAFKSIGHLYLYKNQSLKNLSGIAPTQNISHISIRRSDSLQTLDGLNNLKPLSFLQLDSNAVLKTIDFSDKKVLSSWSYFSIRNNPLLTELKGFSKIDSLFILELAANKSLINLKGLDSLKHIIENFDIARNENLNSLQGLENLKIINGRLILDSNKRLKSLAGLSNLETVNGFIQVSKNDSLTNISSLGSINPANVLWLKISENPMLSVCNNPLVCALLKYNQNQVELKQNAQGCNEDIDCSNRILDGNVFFDKNDNGVIDTNDIALSNIHISINGITYLTNAKGQYSISADSGTRYNIIMQDTSDWFIVSDSAQYNVIHNSSNYETTFDFLLKPKKEKVAGNIYITSALTRCDTKVDFTVSYSNEGTTYNEGRIIIKYDPLSKFISSTPLPSSITSDELVFDFDNSQPFTTDDIKIIFGMPNFNSQGKKLLYAAEYQIKKENNYIILDSFDYNSEVRCSVDPNDKIVNPKGIFSENYTLNHESLNYTIRFQNTGNASALKVVIKDTLDENLDINTFKVISSSHTVHTAIDNHVLTFTFDHIDLPDSTTNEAASHGYINYAITLDTAMNKVIIKNKAYIYFDTNPAVVTNEVRNTMVSTLPLDDKVICGNQGLIFENQSEVDSFADLFPYCKITNGDLTIGIEPRSQYIPSDIHDLSPLSRLTDIEGTLHVFGNGILTNLNGIQNIKNVKGINLFNNDSLQSIDGLHNLKSLEKNAVIFGNPVLQNLKGLDSLKYIGSQLLLGNCEQLQDFSALKNLDTVRHKISLFKLPLLKDLTPFSHIRRFLFLNIQDNDGLADLTGLDHLVNTNLNIEIFGNKNLTSLYGLHNLNHVGTLNIDNDTLTNLAALANLTSIYNLIIGNCRSLNDLSALANLTDAKRIILNGNNSLMSLKGLDNVLPSSIEFIELRSNFALTDCSFENICKALHNIDLQNTTILQNATNCSSVQEILSLCTTKTSELGGTPIVLYPNPTEGIIYVLMNGNKSENLSTYIVNDSHGKIVKSGILNAEYIDLSNYDNGIYFIDLTNNHHHYYYKIALIR